MTGFYNIFKGEPPMEKSKEIENKNIEEEEIVEQKINEEKLDFLRKHFDLNTAHPLKLLKKLKELKKLHDEEYADEIWVVGIERPKDFFVN